jgi:hypothetical protein
MVLYVENLLEELKKIECTFSDIRLMSYFSNLKNEKISCEFLLSIMIPDIFFIIIENLKFGDAVKLRLVNRLFDEIIRRIHWKDTLFFIKREQLKCHVDNYNFSRCILGSFAENADIELLAKNGIEEISVNSSHITKKGIKHLQNCRSVNLRGCTQITDNSAVWLKNCNVIILAGCTRITDESVCEIGESLFV